MNINIKIPIWQSIILIGLLVVATSTVIVVGFQSAVELVRIPLYYYEVGKWADQMQVIQHKDINELPPEVMIRRVFGKNNSPIALAVSQAENGTRECDRVVNEPNGSKSYGLFMINSVHLKKGYTEDNLKDCLTNTLVAKDIFDKSGWWPWSVYKNGSYKLFIN